MVLGILFFIEFDLVSNAFIGGQISEFEIIEISENVCNLKKEEADWILRIDIVEQGDKLKVRTMRLTWV